MAYGFNDDKSKAPVYTKEAIDNMNLASRSDLVDVNKRVGTIEDAVNVHEAKIDLLVANGTGGTEVRELLWQNANGQNTGTINLAGIVTDFDASHYDLLEFEVSFGFNPKESQFVRSALDGGTLSINGCSVSSVAMDTGVIGYLVSGTTLTFGDVAHLEYDTTGSGTHTLTTTEPKVYKIYGIKYAQDYSAEVEDIRVGYTGHVYNTAGDAVRAGDTAVAANGSTSDYNLYDPADDVSGVLIGEDGTLIESPTGNSSDYIPVKAGHDVSVVLRRGSGSNFKFRIHQYDSSKNWVEQLYYNANMLPANRLAQLRVTPTEDGYIRISGNVDGLYNIISVTDMGSRGIAVDGLVRKSYNELIEKHRHESYEFYEDGLNITIESGYVTDSGHANYLEKKDDPNRARFAKPLRVDNIELILLDFDSGYKVAAYWLDEDFKVIGYTSASVTTPSEGPRYFLSVRGRRRDNPGVTYVWPIFRADSDESVDISSLLDDLKGKLIFEERIDPNVRHALYNNYKCSGVMPLLWSRGQIAVTTGVLNSAVYPSIYYSMCTRDFIPLFHDDDVVYFKKEPGFIGRCYQYDENKDYLGYTMLYNHDDFITPISGTKYVRFQVFSADYESGSPSYIDREVLGSKMWIMAKTIEVLPESVSRTFENYYVGDYLRIYPEHTGSGSDRVYPAKSSDLLDILDGYLTSTTPSENDKTYTLTKTDLGTDDFGNHLYEYAYAYKPYYDSINTGHQPDGYHVPPRKKRSKVLIISGQHGVERGAPFALVRFIAQLCDGDSFAIDFLRSVAEFKFIPIVNVYGFDAGGYGTENNGNDVNLNRDYPNDKRAPGDTHRQPEVEIVCDWLNENDDADIFIDFHNTTSKPSIWAPSGYPTPEWVAMYLSPIIDRLAISHAPELSAYVPTFGFYHSFLGRPDEETGYVTMSGAGTYVYHNFPNMLECTIEGARSKSGITDGTGLNFTEFAVQNAEEILGNYLLFALKNVIGLPGSKIDHDHPDLWWD